MKLKNIVLLMAVCLTACKNKPEEDKTVEGQPENGLDAARTFIRYALDGNYKQAKGLMLNDPVNTEYFETAERAYIKQLSPTDKRGLREASIEVHRVNTLNDSTTVVVYSNTYRKKRDSIKAVKVNGRWKIDLKYTIERNSTK